MRPLVAASLGICIAWGCSSSPETHDDRQQTPPRTPSGVVAPDRCRIVGTVLELENTREGSGPCSKAPCSAIIRIDSLLAYGFSFPPVLNVGQTLHTRFAFTTDRSDRWFPALQVRYPGVSRGTQIVADVELSGSPDAPPETPGLVVDDYTVR